MSNATAVGGVFLVAWYVPVGDYKFVVSPCDTTSCQLHLVGKERDMGDIDLGEAFRNGSRNRKKALSETW
jgi:hypothetical protein